MPFDNLQSAGLASENEMLAKRPYIATEGRYAGQPVVLINTAQGYREKPIQTNATLRKDEWINLEDAIIEAARERLVIVEDFRSLGLTYNVGGLGTLVSEWETGSEITDAQITMDGESVTEKDRQEFGLAGVPIPMVQKDFSIGERVLAASRTRGASLDVTTGTEAARAVARKSENMVFFGANIGASNSAGNTYTIPGLTTVATRETFTISDWADAATTTATIYAEIREMINLLKTQQRSYGPFTVYIPGHFDNRFYEDFKADGDRTLRERVLADADVRDIRTSDILGGADPAAPINNVLVLDMQRRYMDLAVASDVTTVQWQSGSGFTNYFKTYAAWAPRLKTDFDGRTGICHGVTA